MRNNGWNAAGFAAAFLLIVAARINAQQPDMDMSSMEHTNEPDAFAAIAHAAFPRSCSRFHAAMQPKSQTKLTPELLRQMAVLRSLQTMQATT